MWALITSPRRKSSPKQPDAAAAWKFFALIQEHRRLQRDVVADGAIDLHEIALNEIRRARHVQGLGQLSAEPAGGYAHLTAKDMGQMALVSKPGLLGNLGERFAGSPQQGLCAFEPAPHHIAPRPNPSGLLERAAEVIGLRHATSARAVSERSSSRCAST